MYGLDYHDSFASNVITVRILLATAALEKWHVHLNNAFLHVKFEEELYLISP